MTQPSAPGPIVLGRIDESFHQVAAAVVEEVLLRLGHHRRRERDGRRAVNLDGLDPLARPGSGWAAVPEPYETGWAERTR